MRLFPIVTWLQKNPVKMELLYKKNEKGKMKKSLHQTFILERYSVN